MIKKIKSLNKTEKSDTFFYCQNASEILSFSSGQVRFQIVLPNDIKNGIYSLCKKEKYFSDYLLFGVNQKNQYIDCPGIYASFSPYGINFTIWTKFGKIVLFDTVTNVPSNQSFVIDFCWDSSGSFLGSGATMAIFVNGLMTCSSNSLIYDEDSSEVDVYLFDSKQIDFNAEMQIQDVIFYSNVPLDKMGSITKITKTRFSTDELVVGGKNGSVLYIDGMNNGITNIQDIYCFENSPNTIAIDDINGNIYFYNSYDQSYYTGAIYKFDISKSKITKIRRDIGSPRAIHIIQKDQMDYPRNIYYNGSSCDYVLCLVSNGVIKFDKDLNIVSENYTLNNPFSVKYLPDKTIWISDTGANLVKRFTSDLSTCELSVSISEPTFLSTTVKDDTYVFSASEKILYLIKNNKIEASSSLPDNVVGIDADNNSRRVLVALSKGQVLSYDDKLNFIGKWNVSDAISSIYIRRGYKQDCYFVVDELNHEIISARVSNPRIITSRTKYSPSIYFNGTICGTARNVGVTAQAFGEIESRYSADTGRIKNIQTNIYKVIRKDLDLSNGGKIGAYFDIKNIDSEQNPTDPQGVVVNTSEVR